MNPAVAQSGQWCSADQRRGCRVLLNRQLLEECPETLFEPGALQHNGASTGTGSGRREVHFLRYGEHHWVLRHYWRGGMIARLSADAYLWTGLERSRPVREWRLLAELHDRGLPAPRPVAARVCHSGGLYRGDLLSERVPDSVPLFDRIARADDNPALWRETGRVIGRFHEAGAWHADLNARNILVQSDGRVWLIDWDRGRLGVQRGLEANLQRLRRSLEKWPQTRPRIEQCWPELMQGYHEVRKPS